MASNENYEHSLSYYTPSDSRRDKLFLACGPIALLLVFIFFGASGLLPPTSPLQAPQDLADYYQQNKDNINIGIFLLLLASSLWPLFAVGISNQLARIPGINITILILQMAGGCLLGFALALIGTFFAAATYRSGRDPVITQLASDLAWLLYMCIGSPMILQTFAISWAIFFDNRAKPLIPRWVGWTVSTISVWAIPTEYVAHCFHEGPLAWDGLLSFWIPWLWGAVSYGPLFLSLWQAAGVITKKHVA
ncbi:integral membrane protein [Aspergillus flavus]|uniref:Integral membrane protein n=1 Tax=Aspergillus flavus TaxID=5059 RepID=A0AB74CK06_ASPFL|nr:integral membrane protein [Aspergillus flavus]RAQ76209.1 integral membrane protein [Aspergillus flavus]RMZ47024.1 integral membrane protein [Aspergillus flavus]